MSAYELSRQTLYGSSFPAPAALLLGRPSPNGILEGVGKGLTASRVCHGISTKAAHENLSSCTASLNMLLFGNCHNLVCLYFKLRPDIRFYI